LGIGGARRGGEPKPVGDVLARYMRTSGLGEKLRSREIYDSWPEVAGAEVDKHTRVVGFSGCVLHVEVDSPPWLHMLSTFKKPELLTGLRQALNGVRVRDIKFRIGVVAPTEGNPWPRQANPPTTRATSRSYPA